MTMLVTVAKAKARLRLDIADDDPDTALMIEGASAAVLAYLKKSAADLGETIPPEIQNATLTLVGVMRRDPDASQAKDWQHGYLPFAVTAFLYPLRDPTVA
jgi:hypothetical protein